MKLLIRKTKRFILTLSQDEVSWLRGYMQNDLSQESVYNKRMRELFWKLLDGGKEGEANGETDD